MSSLDDKNLSVLFFKKPQEFLAQRGSKTQKTERLGFLSVLSVKFTSPSPVKTKSMLVFPLQVRLGYKHDFSNVEEKGDESLKSFINGVKSLDKEIGSWSLIHDIREKDMPTWRIAAEVRPKNIVAVSWFDEDKKVICLDVEGAAVFIGR